MSKKSQGLMSRGNQTFGQGPYRQREGAQNRRGGGSARGNLKAGKIAFFCPGKATRRPGKGRFRETSGDGTLRCKPARKTPKYTPCFCRSRLGKARFYLAGARPQARAITGIALVSGIHGRAGGKGARWAELGRAGSWAPRQGREPAPSRPRSLSYTVQAPSGWIWAFRALSKCGERSYELFREGPRDKPHRGNAQKKRSRSS